MLTALSDCAVAVLRRLKVLVKLCPRPPPFPLPFPPTEPPASSYGGGAAADRCVTRLVIAPRLRRLKTLSPKPNGAPEALVVHSDGDVW